MKLRRINGVKPTLMALLRERQHPIIKFPVSMESTLPLKERQCCLRKTAQKTEEEAYPKVDLK